MTHAMSTVCARCVGDDTLRVNDAVLGLGLRCSAGRCQATLWPVAAAKLMSPTLSPAIQCTTDPTPYDTPCPIR